MLLQKAKKLHNGDEVIVVVDGAKVIGKVIQTNDLGNKSAGGHRCRQ